MLQSIDKSFSEKRDFIRMQINSPVNIHFNDSVIEGICKDLSGTGMQIETHREFAKGDEFKVCIASRGENYPQFNAIVSVLRIRSIDEQRWSVGVSIKEILE